MKFILLSTLLLLSSPALALTYQLKNEAVIDPETFQPVLDDKLPENFTVDYIVEENNRQPAVLGPAASRPVGANRSLYISSELTETSDVEETQ